MQKASVCVIVLLGGSLVGLACSGTSTQTGGTSPPDSGSRTDSGGNGSGTSSSNSISSSTSTTVASGSTSSTVSSNSTSSTVSSSSSSSGGDAGFLCENSAGCPASTPVCCARIPITGGSIPNCTNGPVTVDCETETSCPSAVQYSCSGTQIVHLCTSNGDCTLEASYNECCTFGNGAGSIQFCAGGLVALGASSCM